MSRITNVLVLPSFSHYIHRIKTFHGSFSQEKALVTGYEAANATLDYLDFDKSTHKDIIPVEEDEPHIVVARKVYKAAERLRDTLNPFSEFFMT